MLKVDESWSILAWAFAQAFVTKAIGTRSFPSRPFRRSIACKASGMGVAPRSRTPSISKRSPKFGWKKRESAYRSVGICMRQWTCSMKCEMLVKKTNLLLLQSDREKVPSFFSIALSTNDASFANIQLLGRGQCIEVRECVVHFVAAVRWEKSELYWCALPTCLLYDP